MLYSLFLFHVFIDVVETYLRELEIVLLIIVLFLLLLTILLFVLFFFFLIIRPPPRSTLFPYPTLSRSLEDARQCGIAILGLDVNASEKEYVVEPFETVAERPPQEPPFETVAERPPQEPPFETEDRKTTRLNSSHSQISYAVFCLKKKRY